MIIEMIRTGNGAWTYTDEKQVELVFELEAIAGRDLTQCDVWLNDASIWIGHDRLRQSLAEQRLNLTHEYEQYFHSTEMLAKCCESYWKAFQMARMHLSGSVLARQVESNSTAQSERRKGKGKLTESQKREINREYHAAISPYGKVKEFSRRYGVSEDTIHRAIEAKNN